MIGCLSSHIGDDSRDMWLEALESLLKELRQTVKKKASRSPEVNEKKLLIVTKALCMTLQVMCVDLTLCVYDAIC